LARAEMVVEYNNIVVTAQHSEGSEML
jgi:hypothetical protein